MPSRKSNLLGTPVIALLLSIASVIFSAGAWTGGTKTTDQGQDQQIGEVKTVVKEQGEKIEKLAEKVTRVEANTDWLVKANGGTPAPKKQNE